MILLTGATGTIGSALLRRLVAQGRPVRCLVREPRRLGAQRVRVQIALGDLAQPASFRHALRGVKVVVHVAGALRDQPRGSIEELTAVATWRFVRAAERAGIERFVFLSALGAVEHSPSRFLKAKALAERAVTDSSLPATVLAPSLVYAPGDRLLRRFERLALLPAVPLPGGGRALVQPIWAEDVAACAHAVVEGRTNARRLELAGPETLPFETVVETALRAAGRDRALVRVPRGAARRTLGALETLAGPAAFVTPDEADLLEVPMTSDRGTEDAESLGVSPRPLAAVLGA